MLLTVIHCDIFFLLKSFIYYKTFFLFQIRNEITNKCLDTYNRKNGENVAVSHCHGMGGNQVRNLLHGLFKFSNV